MVKKVVEKKISTKRALEKMSFADLYSMYVFVSNDTNNKGFGTTSPDARKMVRAKQKEIEEEIYDRIYGFNPFKKFSDVIEGESPENINLDRFVVAKNEEKKDEPEDEKPQTFVVVKNPEGT